MSTLFVGNWCSCWGIAFLCHIYMRHAIFNPCSILWMYILNFKISEQYVFFLTDCVNRGKGWCFFHMKRGVSPQGSFRVDFHDFPVPNSEPMETSAGEEIPSAAPQWIELQNPWPDLKTNPCAGWCFGTMVTWLSKQKMGMENHPNWEDGW